MKHNEAARRRLRGDEDVEEQLLAALGLDELWTALCHLHGEPVPRPRTLDAARDALRAFPGTRDLLRQTLYAIEGAAPKPHCFFAGFSLLEDDALEVLKRRTGETFQGVRLGHVDATAERLRVTLEQTVCISEWVSVTPTRRERRDRTLRIATIAYIVPASYRLMLTYEGYATAGRDEYSRLVGMNTQALLSLGIQCRPIPARMCIDALLHAGSAAVTLVRTTGQGPEGHFSITTQGRLTPVEDTIARLAGTRPTPEVRRLIKESLREASLDAAVLFWHAESLLSRVQFWEHGADFFFPTGKGGARTYASLERIMGLLLGVVDAASDTQTSTVWASIISLASGQIFLPSEFLGRFFGDVAQMKSVVAQALSAGIVEPVYKLRAPDDLLEELSLESWTTEIMSLRRVFTFEDGTSIDGTDPRNVLVAFRRVSGVVEA